MWLWRGYIDVWTTDSAMLGDADYVGRGAETFAYRCCYGGRGYKNILYYRRCVCIRKYIIESMELDCDTYLWIIWSLWKGRKDKLFRGVNKDPLELIRYVEGQCHAWLLANATISTVAKTSNIVNSQVVCL